MMSPYISSIFIITVKGDDYCWITYDHSKSAVIHKLENYVLNDCGLLNDLYKTRHKEISTKNKVHNFFRLFSQNKKCKTKNILMNDKTYKDLVIHLNRYVCEKLK